MLKLAFLPWGHFRKDWQTVITEEEQSQQQITVIDTYDMQVLFQDMW